MQATLVRGALTHTCCGCSLFPPGSHVVYVLQKTRRYKAISIDNYHNSHPEAYRRLEKIARDELPPNPSAQDLDSTKIDYYEADLTNEAAVRKVFEKYGKGGIWGVIHIAVRSTRPLRVSCCMLTATSGLEGSRRVNRDPAHVLPQQCRRHDQPNAPHGRV